MLLDEYLNLSDTQLIEVMKKASHRYENSDVYDLLYAATIRIAVLSALLNTEVPNQG